MPRKPQTLVGKSDYEPHLNIFKVILKKQIGVIWFLQKIPKFLRIPWPN